MAVSRSIMHGLLNYWAERMGVNGWHFNQVTGIGNDAPRSTPGQFLYVQPEREAIAEGLLTALAKVVRELRFYHRPVYLHQRIPLPPSRRFTAKQFYTDYCYVDAIGKRGTSLIEADATVSYSDTDGDTVNDLATIAVATTATDPTEVQVFFRRADSLSTIDADERWQIEPVAVSITGGVATITAPRWLFVKPSIWRRPYNAPNFNSSSKNVANTTNAADFVAAVDVYRVFPDATGAAVLLSNPYTAHPQGQPVGYNETEAEAVIEDGQLGIINCRVAPAAAPSSTGCYQYLDLHYRAGYPLDVTGNPDRALVTAICRLANADMPAKPTNDDARVLTWMNDAAMYPINEVPAWLQSNPFGLAIGAVEAYKVISRLAIADPVTEV